MHYKKNRLIYKNDLATETDVKGFVLEGEAKITFRNGAMRMQNALDESLGQKSNFVFWCPKDFPADIEISWDFQPVSEPGLAIMFFAAVHQSGGSIFCDTAAGRDGEYDRYHSGDINAFHVSYYRRMWESERRFHTCNLRKSKGFHLVAQGADPLPDVPDAKGFYNIKIAKLGNKISFFIEDLPIFSFIDDGVTYGALLAGGKIGFRQMAPLVAEYKNLQIHEII